MIISRTPYRISFFGGGTDYPEWFSEHGGAVLGTTIDKYCYLTCRYLPPFFEHRFRIVYSNIELCNVPDEILHPSVREVLRYLAVNRGLEIHHDGDLPARSGMGSSSSFTVGLLHALYGLQGQMRDKHQLAKESIHVEQELMKEVVGCQDQILASYGGLNMITFGKKGEFSVNPVTIVNERLQELNDNLLLFYTGITRTASDVASTFVHDLPGKERQLNSMSNMVDDGISVLTGNDDIDLFGQILHEAWMSKRSLSPIITNSLVDEMYESATAAGATGGKLLGAGGGGFMLLFVPPMRQDQVKARLKNLINVPFKFESGGSQIIFFDQEIDYSYADNMRAGVSPKTFL